MSDVPPKKCPFAILMSKATPVCPPNDPWYTAVLYEAWLEHVDPEEPLWRVSYFGQVVRADSAEENFEDRKHEHETGSIREPKDLGFHAVLGMFGADKIAWRILSSKSGRRSEVQAWANADEIRLIDAHGGVLRNMDARLTQTLNLTKGGQGDPAAVWAGIEAWRNRALTKFKASMEAYAEEHGSALVPSKYADEDGYPLGRRLCDFRQGRLWKGMSDEADIVAWAEALPNWHWDARESDEYRANHVQSRKDMWENASEEQKAEWCKANKDAQNRPEVRAKHVQSGKDWWANATEEQKTDRSTKHKATLANHTAKQKADHIAKIKNTRATAESKAKLKATLSTDESKAKRRKVLKDRHATERRAELERARLGPPVPFVKSNRRRAELHAASTDFSGRRGNAVLYMISEDGKTICRVEKTGHMRERDIVGPVVDPAPPDAFDSESD